MGFGMANRSVEVMDTITALLGMINTEIINIMLKVIMTNRNRLVIKFPIITTKNI